MPTDMKADLRRLVELREKATAGEWWVLPPDSEREPSWLPPVEDYHVLIGDQEDRVACCHDGECAPHWNSEFIAMAGNIDFSAVLQRLEELESPPPGYPDCTSAVVRAMDHPHGETLLKAMHANEKRIEELESENQRLRADSENYRGECEVCGTRCMDMLTDSHCERCNASGEASD